MITHFTPDLRKQTIFAQGFELAAILAQDRDEHGQRIYTYPSEQKKVVAQFENPVLVTDHYRIMQIQDTTLRDTLMALFASPTKTTEYDGISLEFTQHKYPGVWGPSIDTLVFCKALHQEYLQGMKTALEIGSGSGFISKYLLAKMPHLEKITLIDINEGAIQCAKDNLQDSRAHFVTGDALDFLQGKLYDLSRESKYDLIVCNPPYIPRQNNIENNPYEGVGLLTHLIDQAPRYLTERGVLYTNYSSLGARLVQPKIQASSLEARIVQTAKVPLKVFNVLNNHSWMNYLLEQQGLRKDTHQGYDYWHTLHIVRLRQPVKSRKINEEALRAAA